MSEPARQDALLAVPASAERRVAADGVADPVARVLLDTPVPHLDRLFDYLVPPRLDAAAGAALAIDTSKRSEDTLTLTLKGKAGAVDKDLKIAGVTFDFDPAKLDAAKLSLTWDGAANKIQKSPFVIIYTSLY